MIKLGNFGQFLVLEKAVSSSGWFCCLYLDVQEQLCGTAALLQSALDTRMSLHSIKIQLFMYIHKTNKVPLFFRGSPDVELQKPLRSMRIMGDFPLTFQPATIIGKYISERALLPKTTA